MIQTTVTHHCPHCGSVHLRKNGTDDNGKQKYGCQDCGVYGTLHPEAPGYSAERRHEILCDFF